MLQQNSTMRYKDSEVLTSNPEDLVIALYDGAIVSVLKAKECMIKGDILGKHLNVNRFRDIIIELNDSLNMEIGGEIASNLRRLYLFLARYILQCSWQNNTEGLDHIYGMINELRNAWSVCREMVRNEAMA